VFITLFPAASFHPLFFSSRVTVLRLIGSLCCYFFTGIKQV
jgi:hypothetical protein